MRLLRGAWMAMLVPLLCAQSADVNALLAAPRAQIESADYRISGHLVWVHENGSRVSLPITIKAHWFPGMLRVLAEAGEVPKSDANPLPSDRSATHALFEMKSNGQISIWIAHPGDKSPRVLPYAKWSDGPLGPGFSYEDLLDQQYLWRDQTAEGQEKFGARDCDVIKSTPGPADRTHYSEVKTWLDRTIGFPVYVEKTLKDTGVVKEFTYFGLRHDQGVWSASQIEVKIHGQAGSTLLIIDRGSAKANLTIADFSPEQLTRF
jgi:Outer membrane lipoprotein-sorting protein